MKRVNAVVCQAVGLILSTLLLSGCALNQQARCEREMLELQKTMEAQQTKIDELKDNAEATTSILFEVTSELQKCQAQLPKAEKVKKSAKVSKTPPKPRQVSTAKRKTKTSSRTKRKGGCPCQRKRK